MVDRINRGGINRGSFKKTTNTGKTQGGAKGKSAASGQNISSSGAGGTSEFDSAEQINVSDRIQMVIGQLLEDPPPVEDSKQIEAIRLALSAGKYQVDHEQVAKDLITEYFATDSIEGKDDDSS